MADALAFNVKKYFSCDTGNSILYTCSLHGVYNPPTSSAEGEEVDLKK